MRVRYLLVIARGKYHHKDHEGHKVKLDYESLRDLRGRQIQIPVTGSDGLAEQGMPAAAKFGVMQGLRSQK